MEILEQENNTSIEIYQEIPNSPFLVVIDNLNASGLCKIEDATPFSFLVFKACNLNQNIALVGVAVNAAFLVFSFVTITINE